MQVKECEVGYSWTNIKDLYQKIRRLDSNDNNIFKTNKNSRDSDNDIDELQIKNRKYLHSEIAINSHSLWRRKGFWESALLEGVISQITISDGDQSWDDLPPDQLKEAVIG